MTIAGERRGKKARRESCFEETGVFWRGISVFVMPEWTGNVREKLSGPEALGNSNSGPPTNSSKIKPYWKSDGE